MNTFNPNFTALNFLNYFFEKLNDHYDVIKASLIFMSCLKPVRKEGQNGSNSTRYSSGINWNFCMRFSAV